MTQERTIEIQQMIADMIGDSDEKAKEIFSLTPDALSQRLEGVSAAEIQELADSIKKSLELTQDGELSAEALDDAAGGAGETIIVNNYVFMGGAAPVIPARSLRPISYAPVDPYTIPVIRAPYVVAVRRNVALMAW